MRCGTRATALYLQHLVFTTLVYFGCCALCLANLKLELNSMACGGKKEVDLANTNSLEYDELAKFAVDEHNKHEVCKLEGWALGLRSCGGEWLEFFGISGD